MTQKLIPHEVFIHNSDGYRYAESDEVGIPFAITIDSYTLEPKGSVALRERDSMDKVRIPLTEIIKVAHNLASGTIKWSEVTSKYEQ